MAELAPGYGGDCPVAVVSRASQPQELVLRGTITDIADAVEAAGLLEDRAVQRRIPGDQPHHRTARPMRGDDAAHDRVQIQVGGVDEVGRLRAVREHRRVQVAARVEHHVGAGQQPGGPHRQQIRRARAGADELDR